MSPETTSKTNLAAYMREKRSESESTERPGPFLTISRQYGCSGYFLGLLLVDQLNSLPGLRAPWRAYSHEILTRLSEETDVAAEILNRLRRERPRLLVDFFRNVSKKRVPGAMEVRNRVVNIVRGLAYEGNAIIIGMSGAGATGDFPNGLRVRLEAPIDWRVHKVMESEGISASKARLILQEREAERQELHRIYAVKFHREPAFDLVYDCSSFTLAQIAQHVLYAMRLKGLVTASPEDFRQMYG
jgi:cytidylate kinase